MTHKLSLILSLWLLLVSPQLTAGSEQASFVLKDSGFQASSQHRIYWLDNDRVLFTGYEINLEKIDKQGRYGREQNIYIWDTRENRRSIYVKNASLGCYFRGYIGYSIIEGPSKKGPMGQERTYLDIHYSKETWEGEPPEWEEGVKHHPITCKAYHWNGRGFPLLPEHGYIARSTQLPEKEPSHIIWYPKEQTDGHALPIPNTNRLWDSRFVEFLDAYVIYAEFTTGYWLFKPSNSVTRVDLPAIEGGWYDFLPMQRGVFAVGGMTSVKRKDDPGNRGAYWVEGSKAHQIMSGYVKAMNVSPDGCKVAFVREPHDGRQNANRTTLHVLTLAKESDHVCTSDAQ